MEPQSLPSSSSPSLRLSRALGHQALRTEAVGTLRWQALLMAGGKRAPKAPRTRGYCRPVTVSAARGCAARTLPWQPSSHPASYPPTCVSTKPSACVTCGGASDLAPEPTSQAAALSPWFSQDKEIRSIPKWEHRVPCESSQEPGFPLCAAAWASLLVPLFSPLLFFLVEFRLFNGRCCHHW